MDLVQAILLSIVEGITEFLPISSTGHLILATHLLQIPQTEFIKSFEIIIQLGAITSVVALYFKKLTTQFTLWSKIILAFLPTAIVGLVFYQIIKDLLLGNSLITLLALFVGGILLIILEKIYQQKPHHLSSLEKISNKQAVLIGVCQSVSVIPGVSRAAATIMGGMFLGLKREVAVEFSFLLALPTMAAATVLDLVKNEFQFSSAEYLLLAVGFIGSFLTAVLAIKFLLKFVQTHTFIPFGIYRIILSVVFFLLFIN